MNPPDGIASRLVLGPALRAQSDRRLVRLVRDGYETAFEEIVRRYGKALGRYAASIVGSRSEDVTQDAFSKALQALRRSDAEIELRPWLFRIVRNTALNELRDSPPSPEVLAEAIAAGGSPAQQLEQREELADLIRRLKALPEPQRAAIVMRELEGLSHDEIAAALGLSDGGARQAIYRARQALRNGAGMLVPLPLLRMLLASGPGTAEAAEAGAIGITGAAGAGIAFKTAAATVLVAGAVGAGVAFKPHDQGGNAKATPAPAQISQSSAGGEDGGEFATVDDSGDSEDGGSGHSGGEAGSQRGHRHDGQSDDRSGHGESEPLDDHGGDSSGPGGGDDRSGSSLESSGSGTSGSSGSSGSGPGPSSGSGSSGGGTIGGSSGPGGGGSSGSGGGTSSGSGSGELSVDDGGTSGPGSSGPETVLEPGDDHSGPG